MQEVSPLHNLKKVLELGEGQFIEFKESFEKGLQKEIVAFANASGGVIYLGVSVHGDSQVRNAVLKKSCNFVLWMKE